MRRLVHSFGVLILVGGAAWAAERLPTPVEPRAVEQSDAPPPEAPPRPRKRSRPRRIAQAPTPAPAPVESLGPIERQDFNSHECSDRK